MVYRRNSNVRLRALSVLAIATSGSGFTGHVIQSNSPVSQRNRPRESSSSLRTVKTKAFLFVDKDETPIYSKGAFIPIADDPEYGLAEEARESRPKRDSGWLAVMTIPIVTPIVVFLSYDLVATCFRAILDTLAWARAWVPVDGGAYQAQIITPAINGVVLPAIAVLFATMTSTTVVTLRARQVEVRKCLNTEAGELRAMEYLVAAFKDRTIQENCRQYLIQYCSRLIAESQSDWARSGIIDTTRGMDSELYGVLINLTRLIDTETPPLIVDASIQAMTRLRMARQDRITALVSTYPTLHYWILGILAMGECTGFLMEADQELLVFLNAIQLKILFSMLVATFVACFTVFYDLLNPFYGGYQVSDSVDQLYTIRLALKAESELCSLDRDDDKCTLDLEENVIKELKGIQKRNGKRKYKKSKVNGAKN